MDGERERGMAPNMSNAHHTAVGRVVGAHFSFVERLVDVAYKRTA